jgi:hypothetical protein
VIVGPHRPYIRVHYAADFGAGMSR